MFVNFSNHPYEKWTKEQLDAASRYGELQQVAFPQVGTDVDEEELRDLIRQSVEQILEFKPDVVMCQGEFTVTFGVVKELQKRGICCVSACSVRESQEIINEDHSISKVSRFVFAGFRKYL